MGCGKLVLVMTKAGKASLESLVNGALAPAWWGRGGLQLKGTQLLVDYRAAAERAISLKRYHI